MVIITLPAFIIGPSLIALLASKLFKSEKAFGSAITLTMAISLPVMIAGSFVGMRAMRQVIPVMLAKKAEEAKS